MRYRLVAALSSIAVSLMAVPAEAEEPLELFGRISAYADHCGYISERQAMDARFGASSAYVTSKQENDLSMYDLISGLNCGRIKDIMEKILASNARAGTQVEDDPFVHCRFPNHLKTVKTRKSNCDDQSGTVHAAPREFPSGTDTARPDAQSSDAEARLAEIKTLLEKGLISRDDYDAKKREILDSL
jgi:hypothetical protein